MMAGKGLTKLQVGEIRQKVSMEQLEWHSETWVDVAFWDHAECGGIAIRTDAGRGARAIC